jgi:hypothetical protein
VTAFMCLAHTRVAPAETVREAVRPGLRAAFDAMAPLERVLAVDQ